MKCTKILIGLILSFFLTGCGFLQRKAMHGLPDGYYQQTDEQHNSRKVYAQISEDSITIYPLTSLHPRKVNADAGKTYFLNNNNRADSAGIRVLVKTSFDISLISILIKYRFSTPALPNQFSANFNGAFYAGIRKVFLHFRDEDSPLKTKRRQMNRFEIGCGAFTGLGTTPVNSSVMENNLTVEYDGFILQNGITVFVGIQNLSIGLGLGWDRLLDKNHSYWIYRKQPWLGLTLGLKLSK